MMAFGFELLEGPGAVDPVWYRTRLQRLLAYIRVMVFGFELLKGPGAVAPRLVWGASSALVGLHSNDDIWL